MALIYLKNSNNAYNKLELVSSENKAWDNMKNQIQKIYAFSFIRFWYTIFKSNIRYPIAVLVLLYNIKQRKKISICVVTVVFSFAKFDGIIKNFLRSIQCSSFETLRSKDTNKKIRKTEFIYICGSKNGFSSSTVNTGEVWGDIGPLTKGAVHAFLEIWNQR